MGTSEAPIEEVPEGGCKESEDWGKSPSGEGSADKGKGKGKEQEV